MTTAQTKIVNAEDLKIGQTLVTVVRVLGSPIDVPREIAKVSGPDENNLFTVEFTDPKYDGEAHHYMGSSHVEVIEE